MTHAKLYTRKELAIMETSIDDLHTSFYILAIQKIAFHLPHICIIGTNHCVNTCHEAFKHRSTNQDVFCCCDYAEMVVAIFALQILLKTLYWINLMNQHIKKQQENHKDAHVMLCFIHFCLMIENRILPQLSHTENLSLNC